MNLFPLPCCGFASSKSKSSCIQVGRFLEQMNRDTCVWAAFFFFFLFLLLLLPPPSWHSILLSAEPKATLKPPQSAGQIPLSFARGYPSYVFLKASLWRLHPLSTKLRACIISDSSNKAVFIRLGFTFVHECTDIPPLFY